MSYDSMGAHHVLSLSDKSLLNINGIKEVIGFDEHMITVVTPFGQLVIEGESLHIDKLNLESGDLIVMGEIQTLSYEEPQVPKKNFLQRLLG
ncbi:MAG: sporulation protein [Clostridia bacterium]|nr:sporulation protein [Clostridia bacterium]